jgi:hypothetical protein
MIAARDIGHYGALAFVYHERRLLDYVQVPLKEVRKQNRALALEFDWLEKVGYSADIRGLQEEFGYRPTRLYEWARIEGQRGRGAEGQKCRPGGIPWSGAARAFESGGAPGCERSKPVHCVAASYRNR